jgi:hypothetical protein
MKFDPLTKSAIQHTLHCLLGCSVGEVLGMVIGTGLNWSNTITIVISVALAFFFGYLFTTWSLYRKGVMPKQALRTAITTDTASIISMELMDNGFILLVPNAIHATLTDSLFWLSLGASLIFAFIFTIPVNRWLIARHSPHQHH